MAGKSGKSGRRAGPRKRRVRVEGGRVSKRVLEGRKYRVLEGGKTVLGGDEKRGWEVYSGLVRVAGNWENDEMRLEDDFVMGEDNWGASGQGEWKVWEDTTEGKEEEEERRVKVKMEVVEEEIKKLREKEEGSEIEVGKEDVMDEKEKDGGMGLVEEWKMKKEREEQLLKKERKTRERQEMLRKGKEKNWDRKETLEMWELLKDYRELVGEVQYVFGSNEVEVRGLVLEMSLAKMREFWLEGGNKGKDCCKGKGEMEVEKESEVGVRMDDRIRKMEKDKAVEGGRTYGEVVAGMGRDLKVKDGMEVERKLREERREEERKGL